MNILRIAFFVLIASWVAIAQAGGEPNGTTGQNPAPAAKPIISKVLVPSNQPWTDTNLDLHFGDGLQIRAPTGNGGCNPDGEKNAPQQNLPVATAAAGSLIAKIDVKHYQWCDRLKAWATKSVPREQSCKRIMLSG